MPIKLEKDTQKYMTDSIKRFFADDLEMDIGDLKALRVLEFCIKEIAPSVYNQAIADAQAYFEEKTLDLGAARFEPEFDFWKSRKAADGK